MKYKKISLLLLIIIYCFSLKAVNYPKPTSYINDYTTVLDNTLKRKLENLVIELDKKTGVQIAVAIVNDLQGLDRDLYANELYREWGVGNQSDEGVLILLATKDREFKVEVGYGSEGYLTDGKTGQIIDQYVYPFLRSNDFSDAITQSVARFSMHIAKEKNVTITGQTNYQERTESREVSPLQSIIVLLVFIFLMIITKGRILIWLLIFSGRGPRGSGGFGGGSGGFGGFGGFGGGSSGGGGAGRSF
ncbi:MAG: TPM domain-containing protein [Endomicrobiaceae bacterium]|jgi:uncharacterized protein|nr:TPM domain-containing protein [Candidatus Cloacimonadota bacterium]